MLISLLLYAILYDLFVLVTPLHTYLSCLCMFSCFFVHVIKHCSKYWFHAGSHPSLYTTSQDRLLWALPVGTCVAHNPIKWIYGHQIQTYIFPLWMHFLFVCFFVRMFTLFACFLACLLSLLVYCFYACLLALSLSIYCMWWIEHVHNFQDASKKETISRLGI